MSDAIVQVTTSSTTGGVQMIAGAARAAQVHKLRMVAGSAAGSVTIYDSVNSATGSVIGILGAPAGWPDEIDFQGRLLVTKGIYMVATGTGIQILASYE